MSRSKERTLVAVTVVAALALVAGCSLLPIGATSSPPPATPAATNASTRPATSSPVVSKSSSGTAIPVPGLPKMTTISSDIDGVELRDLQRRGALIVDLRSAADYKKEHIGGAVNVPLPDFTVTAWTWSRSRVVVVYDKTGAQGQAAQSWLERNKFTNVYHLFRGLDGYDDTLVGTNPSPIPPKMPVLYYFYMDPGQVKPPMTGTVVTYDDQVLTQANSFVADLRDQYGTDFEYHGYNVTTIQGFTTFLEFGGTEVPTFRLVDQDGHAEQFTGIGTLQTVRSHLKRAIDGYKQDSQP